jgi:hypothetical protein
MTPTTAAALRALEQEMRNSFWFDTPTIAEWTNRLAAVLTQEGAQVCSKCDGSGIKFGGPIHDAAGGTIDVIDDEPCECMKAAPAEPRAASDELATFAANLAANQRVPDEVDAAVNAGIMDLLDEPLFTASMYGTAADADKARDEWRAAQSEPRAAEGAGTSVELKRAYAHQQRISACAAWSDVLDKHGVIDESKAKYARSVEAQLTKAIDDLANSASKPTAAAAVPAGGDAAIVGYLVSPNANAHAKAKEELVFDKPMYRPDWNVFPLTLADKRAQDCKRALEGLSQDALDGGWCFAGIEKYCKGLEARVAELTEADQKELVTRIWDAIREWDGRGKDPILTVLQSTTPAAQAQDAGPK